jgi:hypothetical protein
MADPLDLAKMPLTRCSTRLRHDAGLKVTQRVPRSDNEAPAGAEPGGVAMAIVSRLCSFCSGIHGRARGTRTLALRIRERVAR